MCDKIEDLDCFHIWPISGPDAHTGEYTIDVDIQFEQVVVIDRSSITPKWYLRLWCILWHRWWYWIMLRARTVSYIDSIRGHKEEADYYCCKCNREWTVKRNE